MDKKVLFSKIKQIDSINHKIDNILETQYVEESGQYINAEKTLDGYGTGLSVEGNVHQNIYDGGEINVQPNVEDTSVSHFVRRSLEGELDKFSINGKTLKNLAQCERQIVIQDGEEVEGRIVSFNTVSGGAIDDITIKGVSMQNFVADSISRVSTQPIVKVVDKKLSIADSNEGNLDFSKIMLCGMTYNNLLVHDKIVSENVRYDASENSYTLKCVPGQENRIEWGRVFLKNDTVYTIAVTIKNDTSLANNFLPSVSLRNTGVVLRISNHDGYSKLTFRTNKNLAQSWNLNMFGLEYSADANGTAIIKNPILLEGDYSHEEIPSVINGMESVNDNQENVNIISYSQNLIDVSSIYTEKHDNTGFDINNERVTVTQPIEGSYRRGRIDLSHLKPNTQYTLSAEITGSPSAVCRVFDFNSNDDSSQLLLRGEGSITFTTPSQVEGLVLLCYCSYERSLPAGTSATFGNLQIVEGSVAKPFNQFNRSEAVIASNLPLRGIGELKDTIEKIDGDWYHVQRIGQLPIARDLSFVYPSVSYSNNETIFFTISGSSIPNYKIDSIVCSNLLPNDIRATIKENTSSCVSSGSNLDFRVRLDLLGDISGLNHIQKIDKAIDFIISNNMTILYELNKPVFTKINFPSIELHRGYSFITTSNDIKPVLDIDTTVGVDTVAKKATEISVVFDAKNIENVQSVVNINLEVDGVTYTNQHTFTDTDTARYVVKVVSENPNPRINFTTPGLIISNIMVLDGYDDEYYNIDYFTGLKSVDRQLDLRVCGVNILDHTNNEYLESTSDLDIDSDGYIHGTLSDDNWSSFLSRKNSVNLRCKPDGKSTLIFDILESTLVNDTDNRLIKFGNDNATLGNRCIIKTAESLSQFGPGTIKSVMPICVKERYKHANFGSRITFLPKTTGDVKFRIMMVKGDIGNSGLEYQQFNEIKKSIVLNEYLRSLPNGVCDTIEKIGEKWYHVKRVGKRILQNDSDEQWEVLQMTGTYARIKSRQGIISDTYKYKTSGRFNYMVTGYAQSYDINNPETNRALLNHEAQGTIQFLVPVNKGETSVDVLRKFTTKISQNPLHLLYELKEYVLTEIKMPEIQTMDTHTHLYSYSELRPIIKASTISRTKMVSMKPQTTYTLICTANIYTSNSNALNFECDGVPYSVTLKEGDNLIKHVFTTSGTINTGDIVFKSTGMKVSDVLILEGDYSESNKPEYFGNVMSSGQDGNINIKTIGSNIFKAVPYNRGNTSFSIIDNNNIKIWNTTPSISKFKYFTLENAEPNTKYVLNLDVRIVSGCAGVYINECGITDGAIYSRIAQKTITTNSNCEIEFTTSDRVNRDRVITVALYSTNGEESVGEVYYENISLREYESIHYTYEKYREKTTVIPLTEPLRSLPNGVCDTIEQKQDGSWVVKRRINKFKLKDIGIKPSDISNDKYYRYVLKNHSSLDIKSKDNTAINIISDMLDGMKADHSWTAMYKGIALNKQGNIDMVIEKSIIDEVGVDNWVSMHDGYVYYETNTVREEPLGQINKLPLYNYGTHITTTDIIHPELYIKNECVVNLPLLETGKPYTLIMDINSAYSDADENIKMYAGSAFTEISKVATNKNGYNEYLKYYSSITPSSEGSIKIDSAGCKIKNLQIIIGDVSNEFLHGSLPFGMNSVGEDGTLKIKSIGKNLFNPATLKENSTVTMEILNEAEFILTNHSSKKWSAAQFPQIEFEKGTPYTISYDYEILEGEEKTTVSIRCSQDSSAYSLVLNTVSGASGSVTTTFTPTLQKHQLEIFLSRTNSNPNGKIRITNLQIEKGTERTSHQSYIENEIEIPLTNGNLRKLPNGIKDTIEIINGIPTLVRRVGVKNYNGSESWRFNRSVGEVNQFTLDNGDIFVNISQNDNIYCNRLRTISSNVLPYVFWIYNGIYSVIQFNKDIIPNVNELKRWLGNNPIEIYYELKEYEYEPLPDVLISLKTYEGTTHISSVNGKVYPNLSFKFAANLGAIIKASSDRITTIVGKLEKLEHISFTNLLNIVSLQEQLDNHIKKL